MSQATAATPAPAPLPPRDPLVALEGVHAYYGRSHILHGVDFAVGRGETVSLMGRNGMGKTTTLKTIMGIVRAREGRILLRGKPAGALRPFAVAQAGIAYVPEGRGIFPNLSVRENLLVAARPSVGGQRDWTYRRVLELFPRLGERLDNWGNHLSGGEQQMLTIGRALMTNPDLLLLDEATEGLAPLIREEIWAVIRSIKAAGVACVVVDKNVNKLLDVADRHVILAKGQVVFEGDSRTLKRHPDLLHKYLGV
jgi:branched-chain amino acid transport system ATP-binding protein